MLNRSIIRSFIGIAFIEVYLKPLKCNLPNYLELSDDVDEKLSTFFGLDSIYSDDVKDLDWRILSDEKEALMSKAPRKWALSPNGPLGVIIDGWTPNTARER